MDPLLLKPDHRQIFAPAIMSRPKENRLKAHCTLRRKWGGDSSSLSLLDRAPFLQHCHPWGRQRNRAHLMRGAYSSRTSEFRERITCPMTSLVFSEKVKVVAPDYYVTRDSGLVLWDIALGQGDCPKAGQQVIFHYIGYNESGRRIDSTYLQGSPAKVRLGTNGLIPGFEEGIRDMKPGGKRRIIVPPELGPPVGPSTFFSSKQFEVFDIELVSIQDCTRRTIGFYSDVVCT